jgi:hypothetical protein
MVGGDIFLPGSLIWWVGHQILTIGIAFWVELLLTFNFLRSIFRVHKNLFSIMSEVITTTTTDVAGNKSTYRSIAQFISDTRLMLNNTKANATILAKMNGAGYPTTDIDNQLTALDDLQELNETQAKEYGDQFAATEAWQQHRDDFHPTYIDHLDLARIVFRKDIAAKKTLALSEKRKESQSGYISQGLQFYNNAIADAGIKTTLANKGITLVALQGGQTEFQNLQSLREAQQKETGEAQKATEARDAVYDELAEWEMDYRATAKVVLRTSPQLMEEIGIRQTA